MTEVPTAPARWKVHARSNGLLLARLAGVLLLLYLFIISIHLLGDSFKIAGKGFAAQVLSVTDNPLVGLLIGLLATAIIQSSSTTTSLIVTLAASGSLPFQAAIPMVMGANIGTSVTNTLVSMAHITHSDEFKRAFAGSTVHDFFNLCSVIVLLPLQVAFNIIGRSSRAVESLFEGFGGIKISSPLAAITKPVAKDLLHLLGDSPLVSGIVAVILLFIALRYIVK
ncbi:MAG: Na/Pi cotransporter family protein, partial [Candidatus Zixiibacteriota bacterium]